MKYFLDSAKIDEIRYAYETFGIDGVTTNPNHIMNSGKPFKVCLKELADFVVEKNVVGYDKFLIALFVGKLLQSAARLVGRGIDALRRALFAVLLLQHGLEHAEGHRRFGRGAGLGNDVDGEIAVPDHIDQIREIPGAQGIAGKIDLRMFTLPRRKPVCKAVGKEFDSSARPQIGTADADHDKDLGIGADLCRRLFDAGKLLPVVGFGKIDPSGKIRARSRSLEKDLPGALRLLLHACKLGLRYEARKL